MASQTSTYYRDSQREVDAIAHLAERLLAEKGFYGSVKCRKLNDMPYSYSDIYDIFFHPDFNYAKRPIGTRMQISRIELESAKYRDNIIYHMTKSMVYKLIDYLKDYNRDYLDVANEVLSTVPNNINEIE